MDPRRKHWDTYKAKQVFRSHIDIGLGVHFRPESEQVVHTMLTQENSPFDVHDIQYAAAPFAQVVISERKKNGESVMGIGEDGRVWLCVLQNNGKIYTYEGDAKNGLSRPVVPDEKSTVAIDYSNLPRKNFGWGPYADFCRRRKLRYPLTLLELAREEVEQSDLLSEEWYEGRKRLFVDRDRIVALRSTLIASVDWMEKGKGKKKKILNDLRYHATELPALLDFPHSVKALQEKLLNVIDTITNAILRSSS